MNLAQLLYPKTVKAVSFAMERSSQYSDNNSSWHYNHWTDEYEHELTSSNSVSYTRKIRPNAKIVLKNIQITDLSQMDWGHPIVIESNIAERYSDTIRLDKGAVFDDTVEHTFSKTKTLEEAYKVGLELELKTKIGYQPAYETGGAVGGVEFDVKATAEYGKKWGENTTQTDTVSRHIRLEGAWVGSYEATRSTDKMSRKIKTKPLFEYQIEVWDGANKVHAWNTWEELLEVLRGEAPTDRALGKEFFEKPISDAEYHVINSYHPPQQEIEFTAIYDNVVSQSIEVIQEKPTTVPLTPLGTRKRTKKVRRQERRQSKKGKDV